jgi:hypothetical protein
MALPIPLPAPVMSATVFRAIGKEEEPVGRESRLNTHECIDWSGTYGNRSGFLRILSHGVTMNSWTREVIEWILSRHTETSYMAFQMRVGERVLQGKSYGKSALHAKSG